MAARVYVSLFSATISHVYWCLRVAIYMFEGFSCANSFMGEYFTQNLLPPCRWKWCCRVSLQQYNRACHPGGHYWNYYTATFLYVKTLHSQQTYITPHNWDTVETSYGVPFVWFRHVINCSCILYTISYYTEQWYMLSCYDICNNFIWLKRIFEQKENLTRFQLIMSS